MNKSKIIAIALVGTSLLTSSVPMVLALESTNSTTRLELRQETRQENSEIRDDVRKENQENRQEGRAEIQSNLNELKQDILSKIASRHAQRLEVRFNFYFKRLTALTEKIQTRINNLKEQGYDVAAAQAKLDEAKTSLTSAKTLADQSIAKFKSVEPTESTTQKDLALAARDLAQQAREEFAKVLSLLKDAAKLMKDTNNE